MIVTTLYSSPETKHSQNTPCTSKGSFVGQLIYWPLFLIVVFYIERGSYSKQNSNTAIVTYLLSTLFFVVPISTIIGWERNRDTAISRMTCSLRQPTISLDRPDSRCCKTQKISSSSLRTFDVHFNDLAGKDEVIGSNQSMSFELVKIVNGQEQNRTINYGNTVPPDSMHALQIVQGTEENEISNRETLGQSQIAMKALPEAFENDEKEADYGVL